jgi:hypothetical protein
MPLSANVLNWTRVAPGGKYTYDFGDDWDRN